MTGCSAGGLGALLSTDSVHEQIKQKALKLNKFASAPSSGFFLAHDNLAGSVQFETNMAEAIAFGNWSMPSTECAQHLGKLQSWKCLLAQYAYDYVKAPIFILNGAMDSWQTTFIYAKPFIDGVGPSGPGPFPGWGDCSSNITSCTETQVPLMNKYIDDFQASMQIGAERAFRMPGNGAFIDVCHWHCEAMNDQAWNDFAIDGVTMQDAVSKWWTSDFRDDAELHTHMDQCPFKFSAELGYTPQCNPTCSSFRNPFR